MLNLLATLRVATVDELALVLGDEFPRRRLQRRLRDLFDARCVTRPPAQRWLRQPKRGGPRAVYALGTQGARALRARGVPLASSDFDHRALALKPLSLHHRLFTARIVAVFLAALEKLPHVVLRRVLRDGEFRTRVVVPWRAGETTVVVKPDATLLVEEGGTVTALFVEADRGTMPQERTGLEQSSFFRKVLAYYHGYPDKTRLLAELGAADFVVLTVAATPARAAALCALARRVGRDAQGTNVFWFTHAGALTGAAPERVLGDAIWTTATGETGSLF